MPLKLFDDFGKAVNDLFKSNSSNQVTIKSKSGKIKTSTVVTLPGSKKLKNQSKVTFGELKEIPLVEALEFQFSTENGAKCSPVTVSVDIESPLESLKIANDIFKRNTGEKDADGKDITAPVNRAVASAEYRLGDKAAFTAAFCSEKVLEATASFAVLKNLSVGFPLKVDFASKDSLVDKAKGAIGSVGFLYNHNDKLSVNVLVKTSLAGEGSLLFNPSEKFDAAIKFESEKKTVSAAGAYKINDVSKLSFQGDSEGKLDCHLVHKLGSPNLTIGLNGAYKLSKTAGAASLKASTFSMDFTFGN